MTTASNIHSNAQRKPCARPGQLRIPVRSAPRRLGARRRAYATCHLAGCSTLLPIGD